MSEIKYLDPEQANSIPSIKQQFRFVKKALEDGQTIPDIDQIRANAAKGATAYQKPSDGIPASDLNSTVRSALSKAEGAVSVPGEPGTVGQVLQLDAQGNPAWVTPSAGTTPDSEMSASSTNAVQNKVITEELDKYAKKDGFYESMGVGTAVNLAGQIERTNDMTYRTSGGEEDIATGTARIEKVSGNTVVWNQLNDIPSSSASSTKQNVTFVDNRDGSVSVSTSGATNTVEFIFSHFNLVDKHKYLIKGCPNGGSDSSYLIYIPSAKVIGSGVRDTGGGVIFTKNGSENDSVYPIIRVKTATIISTPVVFRPQLFDLTLIYGEEVANSMAANQEWGISKFEDDYKQWFGKPLTYEPYNEGELIPVKMTGLKTTGFNQWDEEWEVGGINIHTGINNTEYDKIRSKNYIPVIGGTEYYFTNGSKTIQLFQYDSQHNILTGWNKGYNYKGIVSPMSVTLLPNCAYIRFHVLTTTNYNNDICINHSWSGTKDGTYEPYEEHILPFDVTTLQGKLNGEGELVTPFADGLKKAGSVQDEIYYVGKKVYGVKRVGSVDLGSLTYGEYSSTDTVTNYYSSDLDSLAKGGTGNVCSIFTRSIYNAPNTMSIVAEGGGKLYIRTEKDKYSTVVAFKTAMSGVMLYYELAEPLVYELENVTLPARFKVNDWGTEEQLHAEGVNSAPAILGVLYGVNAVDELRNLPRRFVTISANGTEDTMHKFLAALSTAMGGTWAITVNENDPTDFGFTFTPNNESDDSSDSTNEGK